MSDLSLINILTQGKALGADMGSGAATEVAKVELEKLDPALLASMPEELKKSLGENVNLETLPTFETMLKGESEIEEKPIVVLGEEKKKNIQTPVHKITEQSTLTDNALEAINVDEGSTQRPQAAKNENLAKVIKTNNENTPTVESESIELQEGLAGKTVVSTVDKTEPKVIAKKPNLKLVSGEDFISAKSVGQKSLEQTALKGDEVAKTPLEELAKNQVAISKQTANKIMANPFLAHTSEARGGMALSGAMFRDAVSEKAEDEKHSAVKGISDSGTIVGDAQKFDSTLGLSSKQQVQATNETAKPVLELSHIDARKTGDLIGEISNYIDRSRLEAKGEIDVWVHHKDLGTFQVQAGKGTGNINDGVNLKIETFSKEGQNFFNKNAPELVKHLQDSGVRVTDFQIKSSVQSALTSHSAESGSGQNSNRDHGQNSGSQNGQGQWTAQNGGERGSNSDSDRRKQMWQHYQETYRQRFAS